MLASLWKGKTLMLRNTLALPGILAAMSLTVVGGTPSLAQTIEDETTEAADAAVPAAAVIALPKGWRLEASAGVEYDDTLSVLDVDRRTSEADFALVFGAEGSYERHLSEDTEAKVRYRFSRSMFDEFSAFDVGTHLVSGELEHDFGEIDAGVVYRFVSSALASEPFLTLHQISPNVSRFFGRTVFVRGDYTFSRKRFEGRTERDGNNHEIGLNAYLFLDGIRRYVRLGVKHSLENTEANQFDHSANTLRARYAQRFDAFGKPFEFKCGFRYEKRAYTSVTPSIGDERDDIRLSFDARFEVELAQNWFAVADYKRGQYSSNLDAVDFDENRYGLSLGFRL